MSEILPNLYLGGFQDTFLLKHANLVINCTSDIPFFATFSHNVRLPIEDNGNPDEIVKLYEFIKNDELFEIIDIYLEQKKKVFIHCKAGQQRSCAVMACYLIYKNGYDLFKAIAEVKEKHPIAFFGSINFFDAIKHYSKSF